jgi:hypothetical protein
MFETQHLCCKVKRKDKHELWVRNKYFWPVLRNYSSPETTDILANLSRKTPI